ncbi:hypothetical protein BJ742DRAFT_812553 [Cladochytrium replicatum]|nr:hypothetical protein BJ742DRAFT_812553 [Cladochytrium replicatum]
MWNVISEYKIRLLQLLLRAELVGVSALLLSAVGGTRGETSVAFSANHLVAVVLGCKHLQRGFNDTTTETEHKVESRLLLNVVVRQGTAILELLAGEDETLLVRGNSFLVLDLLLHIVDSVRRLNLNDESGQKISQPSIPKCQSQLRYRHTNKTQMPMTCSFDQPLVLIIHPSMPHNPTAPIHPFS